MCGHLFQCCHAPTCSALEIAADVTGGVELNEVRGHVRPHLICQAALHSYSPPPPPNLKSTPTPVPTLSPRFHLSAELLSACLCAVQFIKQRGGAIGIVNGMDVEEWDPRVDKFLSVHYNKTNVYEGKQASKAALQVAPVLFGRLVVSLSLS